MWQTDSMIESYCCLSIFLICVRGGSPGDIVDISVKGSSALYQRNAQKITAKACMEDNRYCIPDFSSVQLQSVLHEDNPYVTTVSKWIA
jgi:hypothetical protein